MVLCSRAFFLTFSFISFPLWLSIFAFNSNNNFTFPSTSSFHLSPHPFIIILHCNSVQMLCSCHYLSFLSFTLLCFTLPSYHLLFFSVSSIHSLIFLFSLSHPVLPACLFYQPSFSFVSYPPIPYLHSHLHPFTAPLHILSLPFPLSRRR